MNKAAGAYMTARDGGLEYEYEASWEVFGYSARWKARVSRGKALNEIDGVIPLGDGCFDIEAAVKQRVERRIEAADGIP